MLDWQKWLLRWDKQQERYIPNREEKFEVMFDIVESHLGNNFIALDLGCGPGSHSDRLIDRFPDARTHSVDIDPMLLKIAQNAVGDKNGRINWIEADLRSNDWFENIDRDTVNVALSSTALHWLPPSNLIELYYQLYETLEDDGIFLNAEGISFPRQFDNFERIVNEVKEFRNIKSNKKPEGEEWDDYWESLKREFKEYHICLFSKLNLFQFVKYIW